MSAQVKLEVTLSDGRTFSAELIGHQNQYAENLLTKAQEVVSALIDKTKSAPANPKEQP